MSRAAESRPGRPPLAALVFAGPGRRAGAGVLRNLSFAGPVMECPALPPAAWPCLPLPEEASGSSAGSWILCLDGEERVSLELRDEMLLAIAAAGPEVEAFSIPVTRYFYGQYLRHGGWRRREARLFKAGLTAPPRRVVELKKVLVHLGERRLEDTLRRFSRQDAVLGLGIRMRQATGWRLFCEPLWTFFRIYFGRQGWRDGMPGLLAAAMAAMERGVALVRAWERDRQETSG
ncbi:MAG: hypothetical protein HY717_17860 [Planctomycetes bacterium]|nr:hypothetical protein [Planctomycetota bacterium]